MASGVTVGGGETKREVGPYPCPFRAEAPRAHIGRRGAAENESPRYVGHCVETSGGSLLGAARSGRRPAGFAGGPGAPAAGLDPCT